ncbi:MAG TPA: endolytic transglycosylase MltG, partial [Acidimicrobiales bacterium]|nr:endolytic transglycosylase MltG [Acidimicrobiales bacterium]
MNGPEDEGDLPWPRPDPSDPAEASDAPDAVGYEAAEPDGPDEQPNERRARRRAQVRRRRRIVALVGGAVLVLVLGFVLWYELESHALGPPGKQVVVTVKPGESTDSIISALSDKGVIGSSLAFQISDFFHGTPTVEAGSYTLRQNQSFGEVRALLAAGPNIYPVDVRPGNTLSEVATEVSAIPGHTATGFEKTASSGVVHSMFSPPGSDNLEGMLGIGQYLILPGESDLTIVQDMVTRFDRYAQGVGLSTASAAEFGMTPYQV